MCDDIADYPRQLVGLDFVYSKDAPIKLLSGHILGMTKYNKVLHKQHIFIFQLLDYKTITFS